MISRVLRYHYIERLIDDDRGWLLCVIVTNALTIVHKIKQAKIVGDI
jgi:hypothetical protein